MNRRTRRFLLSAVALGLSLTYASTSALVQTAKVPVVRLAEIEIDPGKLAVYKAALIEEISDSIRLEPGVLTLFAVAVKDHPTQIRLFETYADTAAYQSHLESAHFKKYKAATQGMVKSLNLVETDPILLGSKSNATR